MKILGIETSSPVIGCALLSDTCLVAQLEGSFGKGQSSVLVPLLADLFKHAQMTLDDVDGLAISMGPGSFTGLRVGFASVKAIAYTKKLPVAGIPTLDAIAHNALSCTCGTIAVILDARKDRVYAAFYESDGYSLKRCSPYLLDNITMVLGRLKAVSKNKKSCYILGDGITAYGPALKKKVGAKKTVFGPPETWLPRASTIAVLGMKNLKKKKELDIITASPLYLYERYCNVRVR
ncbi:MAG: tRNA (adenosine(37)-N6)-threonylcarbamoyltransferase complex dimerization subunit type 1 TsaB [Candidatus Omnitrophica bacterium]|nr:tRNA (adenosine(37)-N6)-threonylcarbamoyltransferase complex dimerization subunit type 1 TsaB [Candidatus Omnitrophota bacterium]